MTSACQLVHPPKHYRSPGTGALDHEWRLDATGPDPRRHAIVLGSRELSAQRRPDWVQMRVCQERCNVICCDNSPGRHATAHFRAAGHPMIRSCQPGDDQYWCYIDQFAFALEGAPSAPSHR
jgi:Zn-finger in ubiquitin-hydrolases and other protein